MKRFFPVFLILALLFCLVGCSGAASAPSYKAESTDGNYYTEAPAEEALYEGYEYEPASESASGGNVSAASEGQKLIRKVYLTAETEDYYAFMERLTATVSSLGGYMEQVDARTSGSAPSASLTIRVPAERLDELTAQVTGYSNITYRSESQQNVTLQYVDTESRIKALETEQERLLALLEQAEDLEQILLIEDRLTEVRYQLESNESSLRALANQVEYATVTLDVRQVEVFTPVEEPGYWESTGKGFVDSLDGLWNFLKNAFRALIIALPYLIVFLIAPLVILLVLLRKNKRRRQAAQQAQVSAPQPSDTPAPVPAQPDASGSETAAGIASEDAPNA